MNLKARFSFLGLILISLFALAACGGGGGGGGGGGLSVGSKGDELAFDQASLTAKANTPFTVTFKNNSASLQHNWVLVKGNDDQTLTQIDEAAASAAPSYVPQDPNIVAHSDLLDAQKSGTVSVPSIPAGTYTYICTFPGHYPAGMKGTLTSNTSLP